MTGPRATTVNIGLTVYTPIVYKYPVRHEILQLDNFRALNYRKVLSLWDSASIKHPSSQCPLKVRSIARIGDTHVEGTQENRLDEPVLMCTETNV